MKDVLVAIEDELMNARAFAKAVGVAPSSITNFVEQGRIEPAYKEVISEKNGKKHYRYCFKRSQIETARFIAKRGKTNNQLLVLCLGQKQEEVDNIADITRKELIEEKGLTEINSIAEYCSSIAESDMQELVLSDSFKASLDLRIKKLLIKEQKQLKEQYTLRRKVIEEKEEIEKKKAFSSAREKLMEVFISMNIASKIRNYQDYLKKLYEQTDDTTILNTYLTEYLNYLFSDNYSVEGNILIGKSELMIITEIINESPVLKYMSDDIYTKWQNSLKTFKNSYTKIDEEYFKANGVLSIRYTPESLFNPDDNTLNQFIVEIEKAKGISYLNGEKKMMKDTYRKSFSVETEHTYSWDGKKFSFSVGDKYLQEKEVFLKRYIAKEQKKKVDGKDESENKLTTLFTIEKFITSNDIAEFERIMTRIASREFGQVMILNSDLLDDYVKSIFTVLNKTGVLHISLS